MRWDTVRARLPKRLTPTRPMTMALSADLQNAILVRYRNSKEEKMEALCKEPTLAGLGTEAFLNPYMRSFVEENCTEKKTYYIWLTEWTWDAKSKKVSTTKARLFAGGDDEYDAVPNHIVTLADPKSADAPYVVKLMGKHHCPSVSEGGFYFDPKKWKQLTYNITIGKNTMMVGPTGSGKTEVVRRIAKILGIKCRIFDFGSMLDPLTDMCGSHRIQNGESVFDYSRFALEIQKEGIIVLDELNRASQQATNMLLPCLDDRRTLYCDVAGGSDKREIKVHPKCVFIATANIGSEYVGTSEIDPALASRFEFAQMNYLPASVEVEVLCKVNEGLQQSEATRIVKFANDVRNAYFSRRLSKTVSTRETLAAARMVADGFSVVEALEMAICEKFFSFDGSGENAAVKQILMGM